jgi:hypothetical protein
MYFKLELQIITCSKMLVVLNKRGGVFAYSVRPVSERMAGGLQKPLQQLRKIAQELRLAKVGFFILVPAVLLPHFFVAFSFSRHLLKSLF